MVKLHKYRSNSLGFLVFLGKGGTFSAGLRCTYKLLLTRALKFIDICFHSFISMSVKIKTEFICPVLSTLMFGGLFLLNFIMFTYQLFYVVTLNRWRHISGKQIWRFFSYV